MHLNKYLALSGVCSRRKAVELIRLGRVRVNMAVIKEPAHLVYEKDAVYVDNKLIKVEKKLYILLNKPKNYITTVADERDRATILDLIGIKGAGRLYPVGRLDRNTTGLIVVTNDGDFAHRMMHPRFDIQKTYHVVLDRPFDKEDAQQARTGIRLNDGFVRPDHFHLIPKTRNTAVKITIHSGKYHIVRRFFDYLGYKVIRLDRIRIAHVTKKGLAVGQWRFLTPGEIALFKS